MERHNDRPMVDGIAADEKRRPHYARRRHRASDKRQAVHRHGLGLHQIAVPDVRAWRAVEDLAMPVSEHVILFVWTKAAGGELDRCQTRRFRNYFLELSNPKLSRFPSALRDLRKPIQRDLAYLVSIGIRKNCALAPRGRAPLSAGGLANTEGEV